MKEGKLNVLRQRLQETHSSLVKAKKVASDANAAWTAAARGNYAAAEAFSAAKEAFIKAALEE